MRKKYDVAVIGGGPAAIFACWEFSEKFPGLSVVMLEEGHTVAKRHCPLAAGKTDHCLRCVPCAIMRGFGGAGAAPAPFLMANITLLPNLAAGCRNICPSRR